MLDSLATRYHLLPSQVLRQADSLDLMVYDVAVSYEAYMRDQAQRRESGLPPRNPELSVNTMQQMIDKVRRNDS
jgi:hypothetical protein